VGKRTRENGARPDAQNSHSSRPHGAFETSPRSRGRLAVRAGLLVALTMAIVVAFLSTGADQPAEAAASALSGKTVTAIATGANHACALTSDGAVACWGLNTNGQLGTNSLTERSLPTAIVTVGTPLDGKQVAQVSAGGTHTCAVTTDGVVACWGNDANGQIGDGALAGDKLVPTAVVTASGPFLGKTMASVSAGTSHTCAVATDGTTGCWGLQSNGRLGNNTATVANVLQPVAITISAALTGRTINSISAGGSHTCATTTIGVAVCWGLNTNGRLGDNSVTQRTSAVAVVTAATVFAGKTVASISAGGSHTCAVTTDGVVGCWGLNSSNQLGDGTVTQRLVPMSPILIATPLAGKVMANVTAGSAHSCAVATDGTTACWGTNGSGRLGDNSETTRTVPTAIVTAGTPLSGKVVARTSAGTAFTCAVTTDNVSVCWGLNVNGRLGDGTTTQRLLATAIITDPLVGVTSISGQRAGVTAYARSSDVLTLSGTWWNASVVAGGFTVTVGGATAANTLATNVVGTMSGTVTVPAGATPGLGTVIITQGTDVVSRPFNVLGNRSVTLLPTSGVPGTVVSVTASSFDPLAAVEIRGLTNLIGPVASSDTPVVGAITTVGALAATSFTVTDPDTAAIEVRETAPGGNPAVDTANAPFVVPALTVSTTSIAGQRAGVTDFARGTDVITATGANWPASLASPALAAAFCQADGAACDATATSTLTTNAGGVLVGTVNVPAGATTGTRALKVTNGARFALFPVTILGTRLVSLSPASGGLGTVVGVSASEFDPAAAVTIQGVRNLVGPVTSTDPPVSATINASGSLASTNYTVNDALTTAILVSENAPTGNPVIDRASADFTPVTAVATISSIAGQRAGVTGYARGADNIELTGTGWLGGLTSVQFTVTLCLPDGSACNSPSATTLSTDGSGALSGSVTVPGSSTTGARAIKITAGVAGSLTPVTILQDRTISITPTSGIPGTVVSVSGANFDPTAAAEIRGLTNLSGPIVSGDAAVGVTASATGVIASTNFTVNDAATLSIEISEIAPDGNPATDNARMAFSAPAPTAIIASITGQRAGVSAYTRSGDTLNVTGANWAASLGTGDFTAELCQADGLGCDPVASSSLTSNGTGDLAGTVTVPASPTTGNRALKVTSGGRTVIVPVVVLAERSVLLTPTSGGLGTIVSVTGTNFDPTAAVTVRGVQNLTGPVNSTDAPVAASIGSTGLLPATNYTVSDPLTIAVLVAEDAPGGDPANDKASAGYTTLPGVATIDSITGQRTGVNGTGRPGDGLNLIGSGWLASQSSGQITARLCLPDGSSCSSAASTTLTTDTAGNLSGTVTVPSGSVPGSRALKVSIGATESLTPLTILDNRTVSLSNSIGPVGDPVTVTGANFDPGANVQVRGASNISGPSPVYTADAPIGATIDAAGVLPATAFTIVANDTVAILVVETAPEAEPALDWAAATYDLLVPNTSLALQSYTSGANSGPTSIDFGSLTSPLAPTVINGDLNRVQVVDQRNGVFGWSLTATLTSFAGPGGSMAASALTATPVCTAVGAGSAPGADAGVALQNFGSLVQLCNKDTQTGTGGTTSGVYTIDAALGLTVPAFQSAGTYNAVMTITLA